MNMETHLLIDVLPVGNCDFPYPCCSIESWGPIFLSVYGFWACVTNFGPSTEKSTPSLDKTGNWYIKVWSKPLNPKSLSQKPSPISRSEFSATPEGFPGPSLQESFWGFAPRRRGVRAHGHPVLLDHWHHCRRGPREHLETWPMDQGKKMENTTCSEQIEQMGEIVQNTVQNTGLVMLSWFMIVIVLPILADPIDWVAVFARKQILGGGTVQSLLAVAAGVPIPFKCAARPEVESSGSVWFSVWLNFTCN